MQPGQQLTGLDITLVTAFIAVAEAMSFVAAAARLETDPSVISRRVRRLEEQLGVRLFSRTTRRVALTEVGERYLLRVSDLLEQLDAAGREAAELADSPQGLLRVSAPHSYGRLVLGPMLAAFLASQPRIRVDLRLSDRLVDLLAEGFDVAFRAGPLRDSSMIVRRLASYRDVLLAAPAFLRRHGQPATPDDLGRLACIGFSGRADWPEWRLSNGQRTVTLRPKGPLVVDSSQIQLAVALRGAGIVLAPQWLVSGEIASGRLVRVLPDWHGREEGIIHALMPPGRMLPAKTRVFLDAVQASLGLAERRAPGAPAIRSRATTRSRRRAP